MKRNPLWILFIGILMLGAFVLVAADAPSGFPVGEFLWIAALAILGWLIPYLLGLLKFSTWKSRFFKTAFGYILSAVVAAVAVLIARVSSGKWPFDLNWGTLSTVGVIWVQFCYSAFVKTWLEKKALTR